MAELDRNFENIKKVEEIIKNDPKLSERLSILFQKYSKDKIIPCNEYDKLISLFESEYGEMVIYSYMELNGYSISIDELYEEEYDDGYFSDDVFEIYRKDLRNLKYDYNKLDELLDEYSKTTDKKRKKELRDLIINMNLIIVFHIVSKMNVDHYPGLDKIDIIQEGNLGLMYAIEKYDSNKRNNSKFSTYAYYWIRVYACRAIIDQARIVRYPRNVHVMLKKMDKIEYDFYKDNGRFPTIKEIANYLNISEQKVRDYKSSRGIISTEYKLGDVSDEDSLKVEDTIADNQDLEWNLEKMDLTERIWNYINNANLTQAEEYVLIKTYGLDGCDGMSLRAIARESDYSCETIRQRELRARYKLRRMKGINNLKDYLED